MEQPERENQPEEKSKIRHYADLLNPLFWYDDFNRVDRLFELVCTFVRAAGLKDTGWDSHLESISLLDDLGNLCQIELPNDKFPVPDNTRARLTLISYCHITEMNFPYDLVANLLRLRLGRKYCMAPFAHLGRAITKNINGVKTLQKILPASPDKKIKEIESLSEQAGLPEVGKAFREIYDPVIRNAVYHSDYVVQNESMRLLSNHWHSKKQRILTPLVPFDELGELTTAAFAFHCRRKKTHIMSTICPIGTPNAAELPSVSPNDNTCPKCAGDVLVHLTSKKFYPNICSVLNLYAKFVGAPSNPREMSLDLILERQRGFRPYLEQRNYADATICNYNRWVYEFLNHAKAFGWIPDGDMSPEWRAVAAKIDGSPEVVRHFAGLTDSPAELTRPNVDRWVDQQVISGERSFDAANQMANHFIHTLIVLGYTEVDPLRAVRLDSYGIALAGFPSPLKEEVETLLALRQSDSGDEGDAELLDDLDDLDLNDYRDRSEGDENRPPHSQIRAITALLLEAAICRLYGYVHGIKGKDIVNLQMLFNPRVLKNYREWLKTKRNVSDAGLRGSLIPILSAMLQSKTFDPQSLRWIEEFRRQLGTAPSQDEIRMKKAHKQLEYAEVAAISNKLYKERARLAHKKVNASTRRGGLVSRLTLFRLARLSMFDLVIRWYLFLPWRQRNMREMRVDGSEPNLVKMPIPDGFEIDRPEWVLAEEREAEVKKKPKPEFWLYRFSAKENKTGKLIYCVLPRPLVTPLEDYLLNWRPILLKKKNTQMLFLNCRGGRMTAKAFGCMICELALRYGGKRMNPHIFRDVFAFAYLKSARKISSI